jgi:hypothetical protein
MAKVKEVIEWLSTRDPEEVIALTGWWYQSDVENNIDTKLTEDQWLEIVDKHEDDAETHISEVAYMVVNEEYED